MFELNEINLMQQVNEITYRKGLDLFLRNKVRQMNIEKVASMTGNSKVNYAINAVVESSFGYDNHKVHILLNSMEMVLDNKCSCLPFKKFDGICEHITAVLIKYCRERDVLLARSGIISEKATEDMLKRLKSTISSSNKPSQEIYLRVKYNFSDSVDQFSWLEIKIGKDRLYVVKDIDEFLKVVKYKQNKLEFGVNFTFDPLVYSFSEKDSELIDLLMELLEINDLLKNSDAFSDGTSKLLTGKRAYLTERQTKRFFDIMKDCNFDCVINDMDYTNVQVKSAALPLDFSLTLNENTVILRESGPLPIPITTDREYCFYDGVIYKVPENQKNLYMPFYESLYNSNKDYLPFDINYSQQIASYIIPTLKSISRSFDVDEELSKRFYEVPLKVNVYFDKANDAITSDLQFVYDNIAINPLNENTRNNNEQILIRDVLTEAKALNILLQNGFEKEFGRFILKGEEKLVSFLSEGMAELQKIGDIYYSEEFKNIKIYPPSSIRSSIRLNDNNLLEFSFSIDGVSKSELKNIFASLKEKKKYYKLKKGGFIPLDSKEINDISSLIEYLDIKDSDLEKDSVLLKKYNALFIDQSIRQNNMTYVETNKQFSDLVSNIRDINESNFNVPEHLEKTMRGYQKNGFKWFKTLSACGFGGILADEMGLGKTLQAIAFIESELLENPSVRQPVLVITPSSLIYNWKSEIEKFSSFLKVLVIAGSKLERDTLREEIEDVDIVITSYPLIRRDVDAYKDISFKYCIIDEAQHIKNPSSQNAQCVKEINANGYFALTGTPIENSLTELWSIFDFVMPGYLLSHGRFVKKYEAPIIKNKDNRALDELNKHIKPFILRRYKKEVVKELPPKIEHKLAVEMTDEQKSLYMAYLNSAREEFNKEIKVQGINKNKIRILSLLTRLRQICCEPSVFIENYRGDSGKMLALDELLEDSINEGHRILLFSQFTSVLKSIGRRLRSKKIEYMYLDGETPVESRLTLVNKFNDGFGSVFLISLKAGGTGLNLTGADVVIHFDPWWNPAVEDQAVDRAHRIGQTKTVEVIKLLARGTIEEKIYELQEKKKEIIKNVIDNNASEDILLSNMSEDELEALFR